MGGAKKQAHQNVSSGGSVASMGSLGSLGSTQAGFSFGGKGVMRSSYPGEPKEESPGPGQYEGAAAIGKQVESHKTTIMEPSFPVSTRDESAKVFAGLDSIEFVDSPGPGTYLELDAEDMSVTSAPKWTFSGRSAQDGKARERFPAEAERAPGPGAYQTKTGLSDRTCTFGSSDRKSFNPVGPPLLILVHVRTTHDPRPTTHDPPTHDPRPTTHDPRPTTRDPRPTTHAPLPTTPMCHRPQP